MTFAFFAIALLYAMAGFGGGSSYTALLYLFELPYQLIPILSLLCNLIVVSGGSLHFIRRGHYRPELFWPFTLASVPMALVGGLIPVGKQLFLGLLGLSLLAAAMRLLWLRPASADEHSGAELPPAGPALGPALAIGAGLGLLAGLVGIGGGIFLAPFLLNLRWGSAKQVAATASLFILVNSLAGLSGQLIKLGAAVDLRPYWPLLLMVLLGGQLGSRLGAGPLPQRWLSLTTAALVLFAGGRLVIQALLPAS